MLKQPNLDAVLQCCFMMEYCRAVDRAGTADFDLGAILGELDWYKSLWIELKEWQMENKKQDPFEVASLDRSTGTNEFGTPHNQNEFPNLSLKEKDPNTRQVGGEHYGKATYQHWDYVIDNNLGYFEGQVTKYVTRWRKKNGAQDLEKAMHYLEKLMAARATNWTQGKLSNYPKNISRLAAEYHLDQQEMFICELMTVYTGLKELEEVHNILSKMIASAGKDSA